MHRVIEKLKPVAILEVPAEFRSVLNRIEIRRPLHPLLARATNDIASRARRDVGNSLDIASNLLEIKALEQIRSGGNDRDRVETIESVQQRSNRRQTSKLGWVLVARTWIAERKPFEVIGPNHDPAVDNLRYVIELVQYVE